MSNSNSSDEDVQLNVQNKKNYINLKPCTWENCKRHTKHESGYCHHHR